MDEHTYSAEILYHLCCHLCKRWWTVADLQGNPMMTCTHCGYTAKIINNLEREINTNEDYRI
jgi:rRNA maturation endonuclease Nob1